MNKRIAAVISSVVNSFCDFTLDIAINKYSTYKILFFTSLISLIFQIIYGLVIGIYVTLEAIPIILIYGLCMLAGYMFYVQSLKNIPIGLAALLENADLFIVLIIDIIFGYLTLTPKFVLMFLTFIFSIFLFTFETNKIKNDVSFKNIKFIGIIFIIISVLFYSIEPYLIKYANKLGGSEIAINFGYSFFAIPFFAYKSNCKDTKENKLNGRACLLIILIGLFEAIYYIFGTIGFIYETPVIVNIIQEIRVFLLVVLSIIFKTDKITLKKAIAIILGMTSIIGIYFI